MLPISHTQVPTTAGYKPSPSPEELAWKEIDSVIKIKGLELSFKKARQTPITATLKLNDLELYKKILSLGITITQGDINFSYQDPVYPATKLGFIETAKALIEKGVMINTTFLIDCEELSPLRLALKNNHLEVASCLLEKGADVHKLLDGCTLLSLFAHELPIVKFLLEKGAMPNQLDANGKAPLHAAANRGCLETCTLLIEKGAEINAKDEKLFTPLHEAALSKNETLIKFLFQNGASAQALDIKGFTPLCYLKTLLFPFPQNQYLDLIEKDQGLTDLLISLRLFGHRFSLNGRLFESSTLPLTFNELADSFQSFLEKHPTDNPKLQELPSIFKEAIANESNVDYFVKRVSEGKLTIVPVKWLGHGVSLVIWKGFLCKCNRGGGSDRYNAKLKIYKIEKPEEIRPFLENLLRSNSVLESDKNSLNIPQKEIQEKIKTDKIQLFENYIEPILRLKLVRSLPYRSQNGGHCGWVAAKMSLRSCLILIHLTTNPDMNKNEALSLAKKLYSNWLTFDYARGLSMLAQHPKNDLVSLHPDLNGIPNELDDIYKGLFKKHFGSKRLDFLKILIQQRPELLEQLYDGVNYALYKAILSDNLELVTLLLEGGAKTDAQNEKGDTILQEFSSLNLKNKIALAKLLLRFSTPQQINIQNRKGYTALHLLDPRFPGNLAIAKLFVLHGARFTLKDKSGNIAPILHSFPHPNSNCTIL